jgi:hypothetical protein
VLAFHIGLNQFHGGFVGVDVFFVISGYRIMTLSWVFLLLAVVGATGVIVGVTRVKKHESRAPRAPVAIRKIPVQRRPSGPGISHVRAEGESH